MMSFGYDPALSQGAVKCPIFQTSTFVFQNAAEGKAFFELAYGLRPESAGATPGLIYTRLNHPNLEILEGRLALWERAAACAVFASGMAAIATTLLSLLSPGDCIIYSEPLYGGTSHLFRTVLPRFGIESLGFQAGADHAAVEQTLREGNRRGRVGVIFVETPANPTNVLTDLAMCRAACGPDHDRRPRLVVDNTFLGPVFQHPLAHGADIVLYSATKYIGGHSDVIAGACLGSRELVEPVRRMRTFLGTVADPWTAWLLLRSLETLKVRITAQTGTARAVAAFLAVHPAVTRVHFPGLALAADQAAIYRRQCEGPGAMVAFEVCGGESAAFQVLDALELIKLAVSLGGTESLAEHPATMTHADVPEAERRRSGVTDALIRLSVGVEHPEDLIADLAQALAAVSAAP